jgi:beta-N-acetylhexosaminidase
MINPDLVLSEPVKPSVRIQPPAGMQTELSAEDEHNLWLNKFVAALSLKQKIGQMIMSAIPGTFSENPTVEYNDELDKLISRITPGGIILFGKNFSDAEQVKVLNKTLQKHSTVPLFIAADQEGGVVSRLNENGGITHTQFPSQRVIGNTEKPENAFVLGKIIGKELSAVGINMNMAPVADIDSPEGNNAIFLDSRSFGKDKNLVGKMVSEEVKGLQSRNVSSVIKHFPGHGDAKKDSHKGAVSVTHDINRLRDVEFVPFQEGINSGADGIMVGHINLPVLLSGTEPATFSSYLLEDILRDQMGFKNLIITDALEMGALTKYFTQKQIIVKSVNAGVDILLMLSKPEKAANILYEAVLNGEISETRINQSVKRIIRIKYKRGLFDERRTEDDCIFSEGKLFYSEHLKLISDIIKNTDLIKDKTSVSTE